MSNKLTRGTFTFELSEEYFNILKVFKHLSASGSSYTMTRDQIWAPRQGQDWHQSAYHDFFDVIAYIAKYGTITSMDMEWKNDDVEEPIVLEKGKVLTHKYYSIEKSTSCSLEDFFNEIQKEQTTSFISTGFRGGSIMENIVRVLLEPFESSIMSKINNNRRLNRWDQKVLGWLMGTDLYYSLKTKEKEIRCDGSEFFMRDRRYQRIDLDGSISFDVLTKENIDLSEKRKIQFFIEDEIIAVPLQSFLMKKDREVIVADGSKQTACDHCVHRIEKMLGKTCKHSCQPQKTNVDSPIQNMITA